MGSANASAASSVPWSSLTSATAALALTNTGFNSTFIQSATDIWAWENTAAATAGAAQSSPLLTLSGTYWTSGSASGTDSWSMQDVIASGANGLSALTFAHTGSTANTVSVPNLTDAALTSGNCVQAGANGVLTTTGSACGSASGTAFSVITGGTNTSAAMVVGSGASLTPSGTGNIAATTLQTTPVSPTAPTTGQILADVSGVWTPESLAALSAGTVTSITFTGDGTVLSSIPSAPVTTTGTLTATLNTEAANTVLAGPTSGTTPELADVSHTGDLGYRRTGMQRIKALPMRAVVTLTPAATALTAGLEVDFLPVAANATTTPTLAVNGLAAATITKQGNAALAANDLNPPAIAKVIYDGTNWESAKPANKWGFHHHRRDRRERPSRRRQLRQRYP